MSVKVKSLYADPREIEDIEGTAQNSRRRAEKLNPTEILKDLREGKENNKRFVWLAQKLDEDTAQKLNKTLETYGLKKFDLPKFKGLHWREEQKRSYPYKNLAAQIIGFSNADDIGQAGIEHVAGRNSARRSVIKSWQDRDRLGRVYEESEVDARAAERYCFNDFKFDSIQSRTGTGKRRKSEQREIGNGDRARPENRRNFGDGELSDVRPESLHGISGGKLSK